MKRKATTRWSGSLTGDIRKDLTVEQLAGIGAATMAWNLLEAVIDLVLVTSINAPRRMSLEVTSRIHGMDGKIAIIKCVAEDILQLPASIQAAISDTLGAVTEHKGYRDAIMHARVIDAPSAVGEVTQHRGRIDHVLLSAAALDGLYTRLLILKREATQVYRIMEGAAIWQKAHARGMISDPQKQLLGQELEDGAAQYQRYRKERQSLPPLPSLPAEPTIPRNRNPYSGAHKED